MRPAVHVLAAAFAGGAQAAFVAQALLGGAYLDGALPLKLGTLVLLGWALHGILRARVAAPSPAPPKPAAAPPTQAAPPAPAPAAPLPALKLHLETPLARGPVWPPGEPLPITVHVRGGTPALLSELDLELELRQGGASERARVPLKGGIAVLSQTVPRSGPFTVVVRALREGAAVAEASASGLAATYREELGRRFDALKAWAARAGLPIGPDATPREVEAALRARGVLAPKVLDELVAALEVALYAREEPARETYEAVVRALADLQGRGMEAAPRA